MSTLQLVPARCTSKAVIVKRVATRLTSLFLRRAKKQKLLTSNTISATAEGRREVNSLT